MLLIFYIYMMFNFQLLRLCIASSNLRQSVNLFQLKALQHELGCRNGLLKARELELEVRILFHYQHAYRLMRVSFIYHYLLFVFSGDSENDSMPRNGQSGPQEKHFLGFNLHFFLNVLFFPSLLHLHFSLRYVQVGTSKSDEDRESSEPDRDDNKQRNKNKKQQSKSQCNCGSAMIHFEI